jgi:hypothetical protein
VLPERDPPSRGEFVHTFKGECAPEHQVTHLELPATHIPLVIALKRLMISCILDSCLPSSLIDEVDVITPELVLHDFIVCLNTGRHPLSWCAKYRSMMTLPPVPLLEQPTVVHYWRG